jgi:hypothetical protein
MTIIPPDVTGPCRGITQAPCGNSAPHHFRKFGLQSLLGVVERIEQGPIDMQQDRTGWHFAPAGIIWCRCTIIDDHDRIEDARLCPECGSIIAAAGSASIAA